MGEFIVGAYLQVVERCDIVNYGVRLPDGGLRGLNEIDVVAMRFSDSVVFLCEVITHLHGTLYGTYDSTVARVTEKFKHHRTYAQEQLGTFTTKQSMLWAPIVPSGLAHRLGRLPDVQLIMNEQYSERVVELRRHAKQMKQDVGNPAFRLLQILEHLR